MGEKSGEKTRAHGGRIEREILNERAERKPGKETGECS